MSAIEATVMDLTVLNPAFPISNNEIERSNFLDTIEKIFQGETELVVVEGEEGIGKTTLLAQFAKKHPHHSLTAFVRYGSRSTSDVDVVRELFYEQVIWALYQRQHRFDESVTEGMFNIEISHLSRQAKRTNSIYYFLVDGLDEFPVPREFDTISQLLGLLPFGQPFFKFIISGDNNIISEHTSVKTKSKSFPISGFTLAETSKYLADLVTDEAIVSDLHMLSQKVPGYLASIRRNIESGADLQQIISGELESPEFFEIEWNKTDSADETQRLILSIVAHNDKNRTAKQIGEILSKSEDEVLSAIKDLTFLFVDPNDEQVRYVSEAFRKFASNHLRDLAEKVNDLLIANLLKSPDSLASLTDIPIYLERAGKLDELLNYLSYEHFTKLISQTETLAPIKQQIGIGLEVADKIGLDRDLVRLSLKASTLEQFMDSEFWRAELEARTSLRDFRGAFAIAQSLVLKEHRIHALSVIARKAKELGIVPEFQIEEEIRALYDDLDPKSLGDKALDIASDLLFVLPEAAIELVEKAANAAPGENALDWSLGNLTISALQAGASGREDLNFTGLNATERIKDKVSDPKVQQFISAASMLFKEHTARMVIKEAEKSESVGDKIFLLRQWTKNNRTRSDAAEVIQYALELAIRSTPYTFNATVLRELALPLPSLAANSDISNLIGLIDSQNPTAETIGPTEDFVRLQLLLARAEIRSSVEAARDRIVEVFLKVAYLEDIEVRATCLAWILGSLQDMDPARNLDVADNGNLHRSAQQGFDEAVEQLLGGSASHFEVVKRILRALGRFMPEKGLKIVQSLNMEMRRNRGLSELFASAITAPLKEINFGCLTNIHDMFSDLEASDEALLSLMRRVDGDNEISTDILSGLMPFINKISSLTSAKTRSLAAAIAYKLLANSDVKFKPKAEEMWAVALSAVESIDEGWDAIFESFQLVSVTSATDLERAKSIFESALELRTRVHMDVGTTVQSYILSLNLAIRAFSGLLSSQKNPDMEFQRLKRLIEVIPSSGERARLFAKLALLYKFNEKETIARKVIDEYVRPNLEQVNDRDFREELIVDVAPALYFAHSQTGTETINTLEPYKRDDAVINICNAILTKTLVDEPFEYKHEQAFDISFTEALDVCNLLHLVESDSAIYSKICWIVNSLVKYRNKISGPQRDRVAQELRALVSAKLPSPKNIQHEGYVILAEVEIARLGSIGKREWENFLSRARSIPNVADRVFVLSYVAASIPSKFKDLRRSTFIEASNLTQQIVAAFDRIDRLTIVAELNIDKENLLARNCLEQAFNIAVGKNDPNLISRQRRLVDLAFRIDPTFAGLMSTMVDDDPAKLRIKREVDKQLQALNVKKRMASSSKTDALSAEDRRNAPNAAWRNLAELNAGRMTTQHIEYLRDWIKNANSEPIFKSYPIYAWFIQNAVIRYKGSQEASSILEGIFDAAIETSELCGIVASKSSETFERALRYSSKSSGDSDYIVGAGTRTEILHYLKDWSTTNLGEYVKFADPYFNLGDLDLLRMVQEVDPGCRIFILTSQRHNAEILDDPTAAFQQRWRSQYAQDPPDAEIVIVGIEAGGPSPIHDRWWLTSGAGLRFGTSYNSIGDGKISEISKLDPDSAARKEAEVDRFLMRIAREHQGKRLSYKLAVLG